MTIANRKVTSLDVLLLVALFSLWGCPKKTEMAATPEAQAPGGPQKEIVTQPATPSPESGRQAEEMKERTATAAQALKPIYFDFDKSFIRDDAKEVIKANAAWLKAHPKVKVRIEGNCDERGTKRVQPGDGSAARCQC